jgi:hypothetical protein
MPLTASSYMNRLQWEFDEDGITDSGKVGDKKIVSSASVILFLLIATKQNVISE